MSIIYNKFIWFFASLPASALIPSSVIFVFDKERFNKLSREIYSYSGYFGFSKIPENFLIFPCKHWGRQVKSCYNTLALQQRYLSPFQPIAVFHIELSHLIYSANQMTGFYMKYNTGLKCVNPKPTGFHELWEVVAQRCSVKKVFLKISQNSQENTCARVSFLILY